MQHRNENKISYSYNHSLFMIHMIKNFFLSKAKIKIIMNS